MNESSVFLHFFCSFVSFADTYILIKWTCAHNIYLCKPDSNWTILSACAVEKSLELIETNKQKKKTTDLQERSNNWIVFL